MNVLLLRPPNGGRPAKCGSESLSLACIAAALRRDGHEVDVLDSLFAGSYPNDCVRKVVERSFDCLAVTALQDHKASLLHVVREVRKRRKDALIIAGGYLPSLASGELLAALPELDFIVRGEGETTACDVLGRIDRGEDWRDTPGVAYMRDNEVVMNQPPPLIKDLDSLPFPARDALTQDPTIPQAMVASSRGCYHRCSFCSIHSLYSLHGSYVPRQRSPQNFVDELESIVSATGRTKFGFVDDNFIGPGAKNRERAVRIADEIKSRGLKIRFSIECRADEIDEDTLKPLKEAGLKAVFMGIESGVQRQLDTFNKGTTTQQNIRAIELVEKLGLGIGSGFILFDPYVTVEELQENLKFIHGTGILRGPIPITKLRLYRGVPLVDKVREDGLLIDNGISLDYSFKDPRISLMYKVSVATEKFKKFVWRLRGNPDFIDELKSDGDEGEEQRAC